VNPLGMVIAIFREQEVEKRGGVIIIAFFCLQTMFTDFLTESEILSLNLANKSQKKQILI
jgi:hypothetical protein